MISDLPGPGLPAEDAGPAAPPDAAARGILLAAMLSSIVWLAAGVVVWRACLAG